MKRAAWIFVGVALISLTVPIGHAQFSTEYGTNLDDDLKRYCNRQTAYSTGVSDARKGLARKEDFAQVCTVNRADLNAAYTSGFNFGLTNMSGLIVNEPAPNHPEIYHQLPSSYVAPYTRPGYYGAGAAPANPNFPRAASGSAFSDDNVPEQPPISPGETYIPHGDLAKPEPGHGMRSHFELGPSPRPKCIETVSGQACGFNCINSLNNVRCAMTPDQYCRSNELGVIACGYNCISTPKSVRCAMVVTDSCISDSNGNVFCGINCRVTGNARGLCDLERYAP